MDENQTRITYEVLLETDIHTIFCVHWESSVAVPASRPDVGINFAVGLWPGFASTPLLFQAKTERGTRERHVR